MNMYKSEGANNRLGFSLTNVWQISSVGISPCIPPSSNWIYTANHKRDIFHYIRRVKSDIFHEWRSLLDLCVIAFNLKRGMNIHLEVLLLFRWRFVFQGLLAEVPTLHASLTIQTMMWRLFVLVKLILSMTPSTVIWASRISWSPFCNFDAITRENSPDLSNS